jgi:hypothetical protein
LKRIVFASLCGLLSLSFTFPSLSTAVNEGPKANGSFDISLNGPSRHIEFSVTSLPDGVVVGETTFQDNAEPAEKSSDKSTENSESSTKPLFLRARFECFMVKENKAVMRGTIMEASTERYIGRQLLLAVQDKGEEPNPRTPDRLTWGIYKSPVKDWVSSDSERPDEPGPISWFATDAERSEDEGVSTDTSEVVGCRKFPLSAITFAETKHGRGDIRVRP